MCSVTAQASSQAILWRRIERRNLSHGRIGIAREFPVLRLDFVLALVRLYGEKRDRRYERAAPGDSGGYMAESDRRSRR
jgi:hypothetical protein